MCIEDVTYIFSMTIGSHVCGSWQITKKKKNWKNNAMPIYKISSLSWGSGLKNK
jgi:hypothetical protein